MKKAVLFDLDGVLLDSMPFHIQAWQTVFSPFDISIKPDDIYSREGTKTIDLAGLLLSENGLDSGPTRREEIAKHKSEIYNTISKASLMPGTHDLLLKLAERQVAIAIVTSSFRENLQRIMPKEILQQFSVTVTGDDVQNGKPHPEPYIQGAERLKLGPSDCVVIENARLGIQSAHAAGMACAAITSTQSRNHLKEAELIVNDLRELAVHVDALLGLERGGKDD